MKKIALLTGLFLYLIGAVNGIGYSCYIHEYPTSIGVLVLSVMAWPTAKKWYNELMEGE